MNQIHKIGINLFIAGTLSGLVGLCIAFLMMEYPSQGLFRTFIITIIFGIYFLTSLICFLGSHWAYQCKHIDYVKSISILASLVGLTGVVCGIFGILAYVSCNKYLHDRERALSRAIFFEQNNQPHEAYFLYQEYEQTNETERLYDQIYKMVTGLGITFSDIEKEISNYHIAEKPLQGLSVQEKLCLLLKDREWFYLFLAHAHEGNGDFKKAQQIYEKLEYWNDATRCKSRQTQENPNRESDK